MDQGSSEPNLKPNRAKIPEPNQQFRSPFLLWQRRKGGIAQEGLYGWQPSNPSVSFPPASNWGAGGGAKQITEMAGNFLNKFPSTVRFKWPEN